MDCLMFAKSAMQGRYWCKKILWSPRHANVKNDARINTSKCSQCDRNREFHMCMQHEGFIVRSHRDTMLALLLSSSLTKQVSRLAIVHCKYLKGHICLCCGEMASRICFVAHDRSPSSTLPS
eukprot:scaffold762_cov363-Pavlova_lutheri.AAC.61